MRVFLTGGSGFVGSAVVAEILRRGHEVVGLARSDAAAEVLHRAGARNLPGDLFDLDALSRGARDADAVVHTAFDHDFSRMAQNCETDRRAIEALGGALAGTGKRLIVTAGLPPVAGRPSRETDVPPEDGKGHPRVSEPAALAFAERGVHVTVVRMAQVHDRRKQGFASYLMAHAAERGVSAYVGAGTNRWPAIHRLDTAHLYGAVLGHGSPGNRYHAVSEQGVTVKAIAEAIGTRLGFPVRSLAEDESADHFGWLDPIVRIDAPASSGLTRIRLPWRPAEASGLIGDILGSAISDTARPSSIGEK